MAQAVYRPPSAAKEERRIARLGVLVDTLKRQDLESDRSGLEVAKAKANLASLGPVGPFPTISQRLYYGALVGLGLSIAPSIHAMLGGLDGLLRWIVAALWALGTSLFIVHGIIPHAPDEAR